MKNVDKIAYITAASNGEEPKEVILWTSDIEDPAVSIRHAEQMLKGMVGFWLLAIEKEVSKSDHIVVSIEDEGLFCISESGYQNHIVIYRDNYLIKNCEGALDHAKWLFENGKDDFVSPDELNASDSDAYEAHMYRTIDDGEGIVEDSFEFMPSDYAKKAYKKVKGWFERSLRKGEAYYFEKRGLYMRLHEYNIIKVDEDDKRFYRNGKSSEFTLKNCTLRAREYSWSDSRY